MGAKVNIRTTFVGSCVLVASLALSIGAIAAPGWSDFGVITELNEQPTTGDGAGQVFVQVAINGNPSGCTDLTGFYFTVSNDRTKRFYATLLSAHLSGRAVSIWTTGTCHLWGFAELDGVRVR